MFSCAYCSLVNIQQSAFSNKFSSIAINFLFFKDCLNAFIFFFIKQSKYVYATPILKINAGYKTFTFFNDILTLTEVLC